jgi:hypothetical protein
VTSTHPTLELIAAIFGVAIIRAYLIGTPLGVDSLLAAKALGCFCRYQHGRIQIKGHYEDAQSGSDRPFHDGDRGLYIHRAQR